MLRLIVVLACLASPAFADDKQEAKTLFDSGRKAADDNNFTVACALFEKSYQLEPAVGTRLNLADCRQRDKKWREAWLLWISSAEELEKRDDSTSQTRAKYARDQADKLGDKLATVVVHIARPTTRGIALVIGDRTVEPATTVIERVDPGKVAVKVTATDREAFTQMVDAEVGKRVIVEVGKLRRMVAGPDDDEPPAPSGSRVKLWGGLAIGSGALTIASLVWVAASYRRVHEIEDCFDPTTCSEFHTPDDTAIDPVKRDEAGRHAANMTNVATWVSIGGVVLTTVFVIQTVRSHGASKSTAMIVPVVTPTTAAASVQVRF